MMQQQMMMNMMMNQSALQQNALGGLGGMNPMGGNMMTPMGPTPMGPPSPLAGALGGFGMGTPMHPMNQAPNPMSDRGGGRQTQDTQSSIPPPFAEMNESSERNQPQNQGRPPMRHSLLDQMNSHGL